MEKTDYKQIWLDTLKIDPDNLIIPLKIGHDNSVLLKSFPKHHKIISNINVTNYKLKKFAKPFY